MLKEEDIFEMSISDFYYLMSKLNIRTYVASFFLPKLPQVAISYQLSFSYHSKL